MWESQLRFPSVEERVGSLGLAFHAFLYASFPRPLTVDLVAATSRCWSVWFKAMRSAVEPPNQQGAIIHFKEILLSLHKSYHLSRQHLTQESSFAFPLQTALL